MKFRATTSLNSRLQEIDLIVIMTLIYILIICEGVAPYMSYFCPLNEVMFDSRMMMMICYVIEFCGFNVWSVSIDKDCLELVNTHFDYSA